MKSSATLLIFCEDKKGIVANVTNFLSQNNGNIISLAQHIDTEIKPNMFFMRIKWDTEFFSIKKNEIVNAFEQSCAKKFNMNFKILFSDEVKKLALFVSKLPHCFHDILSRYYTKEWDVKIPLIISNHKDLEEMTKNFGIDFYYLPITKENKKDVEKQELELLKKYEIDLLILARYMQILSEDFIEHYPNKIINIHHSFLPAFPGAKPYHSAYERGVKIIGATSHYVTKDLDAGPIIDQDVVRISHVDSIFDLIRKGRDLEKIVLARAVQKHIKNKILTYKNKTIVFD